MIIIVGNMSCRFFKLVVFISLLLKVLAGIGCNISVGKASAAVLCYLSFG